MKNPRILPILILTLFVVSCSGVDVVRHKTDVRAENDAAENRNIPEPVYGDAWRNLFDEFGSGSGGAGFSGSMTFKVALGKVNFMPLASVDGNSGMIITEWYNISDENNRIKLNIQVLNNEMNDESISVQLFKQQFVENKWIDEGNDAEMADKIKFSILEEARLLQTTADLS